MRNARGAITIHVALALIAILMFCGIVVDYGVMMVARGQAQAAADAGALAGAMTLQSTPTAYATATIAARAITNLNPVWGQAAGDANIDVDVPITCPDATPNCIRVDVMRGLEGRDHVAHGNTFPTYMMRIVGTPTQGTRATAIAQVAAANATECLKPWLIPDKWRELSSPPNTTFNLGTDVYIPPTPANATTTTGYTLAVDYGTVLTLKEGDSHDAIEPSNFYEIGPASTYEDAITGCEIHVQIGDTINSRPGKRTGPTKHGTQELIDQDPSAYWNGTKIVASAFPMSPRIVAIGMFSPEEYYLGDKTSGTFDLHVVNMLGFFVMSVASDSTVTGVVVNLPALKLTGVGTVANTAAFLVVLRLVR